MNKKLLSILMAVFMVLSTISVAGITAGAEKNYVASVKIGENEETLYESIDEAWNEALTGTSDAPATLKLLQNVALSSTLDVTVVECYLTLDLNDKVLSADSSFEGNIFKVSNSYTLIEITDTSSVKTEKYFNVAENGLWVLTDNKTSDTKTVTGGVITGAKTSAVKCDNYGITLRNITFAGNQSNFGGALYVSDMLNCEISNVNFFGNVALVNGGAISIDKDARSFFYNCKIQQNVASHSGGGIYISGRATAGINDDGYASNIVVFLSTTITNNKAGVGTELSDNDSGGGVCYQYTAPCCFVEGTLVTMADGTKKAIEDIKEGEMVKTFDHEKGTFSSAPVYIAWKDYCPQITFKLYFEGGNTVHCIASHDFLQKETLKYVTFTASNAQNYIGSHFYGEDGQWHELLDVTIEKQEDYLYEVYTEKHYNSFAEGMLSCPTDSDYMLNIYELDENLKADEEVLNADIEKYGLISLEKAKSYGLSEEWYEITNSKYVSIALGKGLVSVEYIFEVFGEAKDIKESKIETVYANAPVNTASPVMASVPVVKNDPPETEPVLTDYGVTFLKYMVIGRDTVIKNNTFNGERNNLFIKEASLLYLDKDKSGVSGVDVWLSMEIVSDNISNQTARAENVYCFHCDNSEYDIAFKAVEGSEFGYLTLALSHKITEQECEHGSVSVGEQNTYSAGKTVVVTPTADFGYAVDKVYIDDGEEEKEISLTDEKYTFTMPENDVKVRATFKKAEVKVKTSVSEENNAKNNGYIELSNPYAEVGDEVIVFVKENKGYQLKELYYETDIQRTDIQKIDGQYKFVMSEEEITVVATFEKKQGDEVENDSFDCDSIDCDSVDSLGSFDTIILKIKAFFKAVLEMFTGFFK